MNPELCPNCGQVMPSPKATGPITDAELDALSAWWHTGSVRRAADLLSRADRTVINQLYKARIRNGVHSTVALAQLHLGHLRTMRDLVTQHKSTTRKVA